MQTYANRQANLSPDGEDMCKSRLQEVLDEALCSNERAPRTPTYGLHRAWSSSSTRVQSVPLHPLFSACIMWSDPDSLGAGARTHNGPDAVSPAWTAKCPPAPNHHPLPSGWEGSVAAHSS